MAILRPPLPCQAQLQVPTKGRLLSCSSLPHYGGANSWHRGNAFLSVLSKVHTPGTINLRNFKVFFFLIPPPPISAQWPIFWTQISSVIQVDTTWYPLPSGGQFARPRASGLSAAYLPGTPDYKPREDEDHFVYYRIPLPTIGPGPSYTFSKN